MFCIVFLCTVFIFTFTFLCLAFLSVSLFISSFFRLCLHLSICIYWDLFSNYLVCVSLSSSVLHNQKAYFPSDSPVGSKLFILWWLDSCCMSAGVHEAFGIFWILEVSPHVPGVEELLLLLLAAELSVVCSWLIELTVPIEPSLLFCKLASCTLPNFCNQARITQRKLLGRFSCKPGCTCAYTIPLWGLIFRE